MKGRMVRWLENSRGSGVLLIVVLLGLWQFSALYVMNTPTWPPVTRIFAVWYENVADGTLIKHLFATLWRQMLGYSLAVLVGITLGLTMGYYRILNNLLEHSGTISVLLIGGWLAIQGRTDVGTIVAFVSGFEKISEPWRELVSFYRRSSDAGVKYRLVRDALGLWKAT